MMRGVATNHRARFTTCLVYVNEGLLAVAGVHGHRGEEEDGGIQNGRGARECPRTRNSTVCTYRVCQSLKVTTRDSNRAFYPLWRPLVERFNALLSIDCI